jgi:hypothetical protein
VKPILKNRTAPEIEEAVVEIAIEQPAWGQVRVSEALKLLAGGCRLLRRLDPVRTRQP